MSAYDDFRAEQEAKLAALIGVQHKKHLKGKDTITKTSVIVDVIARIMGWSRDNPDTVDKHFRHSAVKPYLIEQGVLVRDWTRHHNAYTVSLKKLVHNTYAYKRQREKLANKKNGPPTTSQMRRSHERKKKNGTFSWGFRLSRKRVPAEGLPHHQ